MTKRFIIRLALLTVLGSASVLAFSVPSSFREIQGNGADHRNDRQWHDDRARRQWQSRRLVPPGRASPQRPLRDADGDRRRGADASEPATAGLPGFRRRYGGALASQSGRQDARDPHRRPELPLQAGWHGRCRELDAVHLPLQREAAVPSVAEAGHQAGELARGPRVLTRRQHALRRRRQRRCRVRVHEERRQLCSRAADCARTLSTGLHRQRAESRRGDQRAAQRQRSGRFRRRPHAGRRQQLQRFDQRDRHRDAHGSLRARPAAVLREQRRAAGRSRRHVPVRRRDQGKRHGLRLIGSRSTGRRRGHLVANGRAPD